MNPPAIEWKLNPVAEKQKCAWDESVSNLREIEALPGFIITGKNLKKFAGTSRACSRRNREEEQTINCKKR